MTIETRIKVLQDLLPEVFAEGKLDLERLKLALGEYVEDSPERYGLNWNGKREAIKNVQIPSEGCLRPVPDESVNWDRTQNLIIEGENLEVLKLLQKSYHSKVKMIYIDPPYNTGNEFIYPDDFKDSLKQYLQYSGQRNAEGLRLSTNTETQGRFHSRWLNMMYPRLFLARNLLRPDGVIFISIDDHELKNLRMLMDEIFGEENFLVNLVWENKEGGGGSDSRAFKCKHEYILVYARNLDQVKIRGLALDNEESYNLRDEYWERRGPYKLQALAQASIQYSPSLDYGIEAPDGTLIYPSYEHKRACYRWSKEKVEWGLKHGFIVIKKDTQDNWKVWSKQYLLVDNEDRPLDRASRPGGVIEKYSTTLASKQLEELFGAKVFDYSKPYELIGYLINLAVEPHEEALVLDFFAGSGSTGQAVLDLNKQDGGNRRFILVQLPEPIANPNFSTIAEITRERIKRVLAKTDNVNLGTAKTEEGKQIAENKRGFKLFKLDSSNFRTWNGEGVRKEGLAQELKLVALSPFFPGRDEWDLLYEVLLKAGLPLEIEVEKQAMGRQTIFAVAKGKWLLCLETKIEEETLHVMMERKPQNILCLDRAFAGQDRVKTNMVSEMKEKGISFTTI